MKLRVREGRIITVLCKDVEKAYTELVCGVPDIALLKYTSDIDYNTVDEFAELVKNNNLRGVILLGVDDRVDNIRISNISDVIMVYKPEGNILSCIKSKTNELLGEYDKADTSCPIPMNTEKLFVFSCPLSDYEFIPSERYVIKVPEYLIRDVRRILRDKDLLFCELLTIQTLDLKSININGIVLASQSAVIQNTDSAIVCRVWSVSDGTINVDELCKHGNHNRPL